MDNFTGLTLEQAFTLVLNHPGFKKITREDLAFCDVFCNLVREAPIDVVRKLKPALELIAYETDDHNEASGFLMSVAILGGGFDSPPGVNASDFLNDIPIANTDEFAQWILTIPAPQRSQALAAVNHELLKRVVKIPSQDYAAKLAHKQMCTLKYYGLEAASSLLAFANFATENFDSRFNVAEQIPSAAWAVFQARPEGEREQLIEKWWGKKAQVPNDFIIALAWQRQGHICIHKGKNYHEAVAEYLLFNCEGGDPNYAEPIRLEYGITALRLDPFLEQDLYEGLAQKDVCRWLVSHNIPHRVDYLENLFGAGVLAKSQIINLLESALAVERNKNIKISYRQLVAALA